MISIDINNSLKFINKENLNKNFQLIENFSNELRESVPNFINLIKEDKEKLLNLEKIENDIKDKSDTLIVVGIGGSFLGAKACIEILSQNSKVYFAGTSFSSVEMQKIFNIIENENLSINVISKSGSTLETLVTLSLIEQKMKEKYGQKFNERIYITTEDNINNPLKITAFKNNYKLIRLEKEVTGRFSIFSLAGLLPMKFAGINVNKMLNGAQESFYNLERHSNENSCHTYAALRYTFYEEGKLMEILSLYEPSFFYFGEWWKQLFGESEGKGGKGIFPSSVIYSRDLHSLGQYIQDGIKFFFETTINIENINNSVSLPTTLPSFINSLKGLDLEKINKIALESTVKAHSEGNVPGIILNLPCIDEFNLGKLIYFFQKACYLSAKLLGVNPFDNEAVDLYKNKMKKSLKLEKI